MRAKLYGGKPPRDGQNSGGVDFVERKRHGAERKPARLVQEKAALCPKNGREVGGEKTALGQANCRGVFGEETA
ncbi:hypothetical protein T11_16288, partial [Trichinella zimbabwensis]